MGLIHVKEVLRPASLSEALALLQERGDRACPLGGGIEIVRYPLSQTTTLVDLSALPLSYVKESEGGLVIGATTTLREVKDHPLVASYLDGVIPRMLRQVASPLLRNLATVGGTLVSANPWSDVITLFAALDAGVTLFDGRLRSGPLSALYPTGKRLRGAILTEVVLPAIAPGSAAAFQKFSRTGFDVAMLNCACFVEMDGGRCVLARVAAGGTPWLAARVPQAEQALTAAPWSAEIIDRVAQTARDFTKVGEDRRASADYRRQLVYVGVRRCLMEIGAQLERDAHADHADRERETPRGGD